MGTTEHSDELAMIASRDHLAETVAEVQHGGRRVAAVVPVDESELLDRLETDYFARRAEEILATQGDKPFKPYGRVLAEVAEAERGEAAA